MNLNYLYIHVEFKIIYSKHITLILYFIKF